MGDQKALVRRDDLACQHVESQNEVILEDGVGLCIGVIDIGGTKPCEHGVGRQVELGVLDNDRTLVREVNCFVVKPHAPYTLLGKCGHDDKARHKKHNKKSLQFQGRTSPPAADLSRTASVYTDI